MIEVDVFWTHKDIYWQADKSNNEILKPMIKLIFTYFSIIND